MQFKDDLDGKVSVLNRSFMEFELPSIPLVIGIRAIKLSEDRQLLEGVFQKKVRYYKEPRTFFTKTKLIKYQFFSGYIFIRGYFDKIQPFGKSG